MKSSISMISSFLGKISLPMWSPRRRLQVPGAVFSAALIAGLLLPAGLEAANVVSVTGSTTSDLGIYGTGYQAIGVSWTQTGTYSGVAVAAELMGSGPGTAWLTNAIGPSATISNLISSAVFNAPGSPTLVQLFSGLTLPSGTYYLTLGANGGAAGGWNYSTSPTVSTAVGVTSGASYFTSSSVAFVPSSTFSNTPTQNLKYQVTGTAVPEPSLMALLGMGYLIISRRRRQ